MNRRLTAAMGTSLLLTILVGCAATPQPTASPAVTSADSTAPTPTAASPAPSQTQPGEADAIIGTVLRFTSDRTSVDVTVGEDSPAVRDLLSMLPLALAFEDLSGREQIAYLPRELNIEGSPGSDPEDGDLIYFTSWGNLGFYYNAEGIHYSDTTLHIGTYDAPADQIALLEGGLVTIEIVE